MNNIITSLRRHALLAIISLAAVSSTGCTMMKSMVGLGPDRPAPSEFGMGPRVSKAGLYSVSLEPVEPLAKRKLQVVRVRLVDAAGGPVGGATMTVDGGMPQHGHGLPTKPRVTRMIELGVYEIGGVRFNMGGWWEFKLAISAKAGTDSVTFNLAL